MCCRKKRDDFSGTGKNVIVVRGRSVSVQPAAAPGSGDGGGVRRPKQGGKSVRIFRDCRQWSFRLQSAYGGYGSRRRNFSTTDVAQHAYTRPPVPPQLPVQFFDRWRLQLWLRGRRRRRRGWSSGEWFFVVLFFIFCPPFYSYPFITSSCILYCYSFRSRFVDKTKYMQRGRRK